MNKNSKGITLIALVITIIVLLILAAVSLNLVAGGDGILGKATTAVNNTNIAKIEEEIELAMAELKTNFYEEKYVNRNNEIPADFEDYAAEMLASEDGVKTANGTIKLVGTTITYENEKTGEKTEGEFNPETAGITIKDGASNDSGNSGENQTPEPIKYTVSYNANGGTGSVPASVEYEEGKTATVDFEAVPTKEGFKFLGWAETPESATATYTSTGTNSFTMGTANVTLYAVWQENAPLFASQIDTANYGDYVDLGTELLPTTDGVITQKLGEVDGVPQEQPLTDWRIFHEDTDGGIYLILADYLPYSHETIVGSGLINGGSTYPYNWKSGTSRADLIERLEGTASVFEGINPWNNLIDISYVDKGISVIGALSLEKWIASWNAKNTTQLYTQYTTDIETYNAEGYLVGTENPPTTYYQNVNSDMAGYQNTLYFPHAVALSNTYAYWLASMSAGNTNYVMSVDINGSVHNYNYGNACGIRPAVYLPSNIKAEKNAEGIWELAI